MAFSDHSDRLDEAVEAHLGDGPCTYVGAGFVAEGIGHMLDRDWEVFDNENQLATRLTTISVRISDVPASASEDTILVGGVTWTVREIITDDGRWRRLYVTR